MQDKDCDSFKSHYSHHWHDGAFRCFGVPFRDFPQLTIRYNGEANHMCYEILERGVQIDSCMGFSLAVAILHGKGMPHSEAMERTTRAFENGYDVAT